MTLHRLWKAAASATVIAVVLTACGGTSRTVTVQPGIGNLVLMRGTTNASPGVNCDPPMPPRPDPVARWDAEPPQNKTRLAAGFEVWRNTTGACTENQGLMYRGIIQYDLSAVAAVQGTTTKAVFGFSSKVLPSGVTPNASNLCDSHSGGLGSLFQVTPPLVQLASTMTNLTGPNASFPAGTRLVAFPMPWVAGVINPIATADPAGPASASFTIDVTSPVLNALAANTSTIQFMISGSDEAFPRPTPPPSSIDCRTLFEINPLQVTVLK